MSWTTKFRSDEEDSLDQRPINGGQYGQETQRRREPLPFGADRSRGAREGRDERVKEVGAPHAGKYEAGFELGKAYLRNQITRQQLKAGEQWAQDVDRYCRLHGFPSPFPKAMDFLSVRGGPSGLEPSADEVRVTSNTYMRALTAIGTKGRGAEVACRSLCVENTDPRAWPFHTWQALRAGLSALASLYDIHDFVEKDEKAA
jgi:hypothetical protein